MFIHTRILCKPDKDYKTRGWLVGALSPVNHRGLHQGCHKRYIADTYFTHLTRVQLMIVIPVRK